MKENPKLADAINTIKSPQKTKKITVRKLKTPLDDEADTPERNYSR